jgi:IS5 family transposase
MVTENLYIQYFLGHDSFTLKPPFDSSLFVEMRKRKGMEQLNRINDVIYQVASGNRSADKADDGSDDDNDKREF